MLDMRKCGCLDVDCGSWISQRRRVDDDDGCVGGIGGFNGGRSKLFAKR